MNLAKSCHQILASNLQKRFRWVLTLQTTIPQTCYNTTCPQVVDTIRCRLLCSNHNQRRCLTSSFMSFRSEFLHLSNPYQNHSTRTDSTRSLSSRRTSPSSDYNPNFTNPRPISRTSNTFTNKFSRNLRHCSSPPTRRKSSQLKPFTRPSTSTRRSSKNQMITRAW